jgi:anti-sigma-K factor RskA
MAAALLLATAGLPGSRQLAEPRYLVVLVAPEDKAPGWVVQAGTEQSLRLIPLGVTEVPQAKALQFWTKGKDWKGPVSLGLVQPGKPLDVQLKALPPLEPDQLFEITLEPEYGSPIGRPTGPILYIGRAVKVM